MRNELIILLILLICLPIAYSYNYIKFEYKNQSSKYVTSNVETRGFICGDVNCITVINELWGGQKKSSDFDSTIYDITLEFPSLSQVTSNAKQFVFFSYNSNYKPNYYKLPIDSQSSYNTYNTPYFSPSYHILTLNKASTCSSPISLSVVNNIRENLPVSVTSGASMSSETKAAFGFQSNIYTGWIRGSEFEKYHEVETTLRLKIYKYNSTTSKNIGTPIHTENVVKRIYYDDTVNVEFTDWMPPEQIDQFSYYNVTVESDVTDPKCSSKINQRASKILRVWRNDPRNQCYSLIDTDGLVFSPVDYPNRLPEVGQEVTITLRKLSNYANDYEPWDPLFTLTPQSTNINLRLKQRDFTDILITQTLPENPDANFKDVTFKWIPTKAGLFTMEVTADAATCPVSSDIISNAYIQQLTVFEKPSYKLKFIVKSEGNTVSGAKVIIANPILENLTTALGVTSFRLQRGIRSYNVEKDSYLAG